MRFFDFLDLCHTSSTTDAVEEVLKAGAYDLKALEDDYVKELFVQLGPKSWYFEQFGSAMIHCLIQYGLDVNAGENYLLKMALKWDEDAAQCLKVAEDTGCQIAYPEGIEYAQDEAVRYGFEKTAAILLSLKNYPA